MLHCNETITFVRHFKEKDGDRYECTVVRGASWHSKRVVAFQDKGLVSATETCVRVPVANMPQGFTPREKDFVCRGAVTNITQQADLQRYTHFQAMSVGDNRRGRLAHWVVSGA